MERDSQLTHRNSQQRMELEPTPLPSWDSQPSAAPPGVTPLPPTPAALPPAGLEAAEQAARRRAEQVIDDAVAAAELAVERAAERAQLLPKQARATRPHRWERTERVSQAAPPTVAEVLRMVRIARRQLAEGRAMAGVRSVLKRAGASSVQAPKHPADRTRAVMRWTRRVLGRAVGLKQVRPVIEALRPIVAERERQAARKAAGL